MASASPARRGGACGGLRRPLRDRSPLQALRRRLPRRRRVHRQVLLCVSGETGCAEGRGCFSTDGDSCGAAGTPCPPDTPPRAGARALLRFMGSAWSPISALHVTLQRFARGCTCGCCQHGRRARPNTITCPCDRVEEEAEVSANRYRPRARLAAGSTSGRVFVRRGGSGRCRAGEPPGVRRADGRAPPPSRASLDVNGDGLSDQISGSTTGSGAGEARMTLQIVSRSRGQTRRRWTRCSWDPRW